MLSSSATKPRRVRWGILHSMHAEPMQRDTLRSLMHAADRAGHAGQACWSAGIMALKLTRYDLPRTVPTVSIWLTEITGARHFSSLVPFSQSLLQSNT